MSHPRQEASTDVLGPVDVVAFRLPATGVSAGWSALREAVERGHLLVLDIDFVTKTDQGLRPLSPEQIVALGAGDLADAHSGLLDDADLAFATDALDTGDVAVVILKETLTFAPVLVAFAQEGSALLTEETVVVEDLEAALDERQDQS